MNQLANTYQVHERTGIPTSRIKNALKRGELRPDAHTVSRQPLFNASRLPEIKKSLTQKPQ